MSTDTIASLKLELAEADHAAKHWQKLHAEQLADYMDALVSYKREHMAHSVTLERLQLARDMLETLGGHV